jgi:hypothetical protein
MGVEKDDEQRGAGEETEDEQRWAGRQTSRHAGKQGGRHSETNSKPRSEALGDGYAGDRQHTQKRAP